MNDNKSIINQMDEFIILVLRLKDLKIDVSKQLQVVTLIAKLLANWNNYRKKLLHTIENFTIDQLIKHIYTEEETHICESKYAIEIDTKMNFVKSKEIGDALKRVGRRESIKGYVKIRILKRRRANHTFSMEREAISRISVDFTRK